MTSGWAYENFAKLRSEHFDPLCQELELHERNMETGERYAITSAANGAVRVYFEHDRGLCGFALSPADEVRPMCAVETIALRFPRIRLLAAGTRRLSFVEQAQFIREHWTELQQMFGSGLAETRAWMAARAAEWTAKYTRRED